MTNIVKDRYLEPDGKPVESGMWRRFVSPLTLATTMAGSIVACALPEEKTQIPPAIIFSYAALSLVLTGQRRQFMIDDLADKKLDGFVIDTQSETKKHDCTEAELARIKARIASGIIVRPAIAGGLCVLSFKISSLYTGLAFAMPYIPSPLADAFEQNALLTKIEDDKWFIVKRGEMVKQEETAAANTNAPAPKAV